MPPLCGIVFFANAADLDAVVEDDVVALAELLSVDEEELAALELSVDVLVFAADVLVALLDVALLVVAAAEELLDVVLVALLPQAASSAADDTATTPAESPARIFRRLRGRRFPRLDENGSLIENINLLWCIRNSRGAKT